MSDTGLSSSAKAKLLFGDTINLQTLENRIESLLEDDKRKRKQHQHDGHIQDDKFTDKNVLHFQHHHHQSHQQQQLHGHNSPTFGTAAGLPSATTTSSAAAATTTPTSSSSSESKSFFDFVKIEITRGYVLEHDEERYSARREKIYTFMKIPRALEKFMAYGVLQCIDSFLYIHTFLPIRFLLALWALIWRSLGACFGWRRRNQRFLSPAEICDLLKGSIWITATLIIISIDTNRMYHIVKSQSVIKLYIFYNMLEVGDRLLSAFGQDTIDALFWTATEPKDRGRKHLGLISHILFALIYIILHSALIMLQVTTLNVAINSNNKGLLAIMMSNNFVELKGSVFKKFDKNNLFQLTCSDVRERVHLTILLFVVVIQTMKEFNWQGEHFFVLLPDCLYVLLVEICIDWLKHAFITRFNELPDDVYKEYTISLAYDMTQTHQKHAFSDHSDLVARRMGFIPYPLGIVLIKTLYTAISFNNFASIILLIIAYLTLLTFRTFNTICALGKACDLMEKHKIDKNQNNGGGGGGGGGGSGGGIPSGSSTTSAAATIITSSNINTTTGNVAGLNLHSNLNSQIGGIGFSSTIQSKQTPHIIHTTDTATSPMHHSFLPLQRSHTTEEVNDHNFHYHPSQQQQHHHHHQQQHHHHQQQQQQQQTQTNKSFISDGVAEMSLLSEPSFGATALFSNSDVDLDDICLNEQLLNNTKEDDIFDVQPLTSSVPDLHKNVNLTNTNNSGDFSLKLRTHKRSESEPYIQNEHIDNKHDKSC